jgi:pantetheine-phosphate adenylyltransferase
MSRVLYPGSFDPIHNGHAEIVELAAELFGSVVVAAMVNPQKVDGTFSLAERMAMITESLQHLPTVEVVQRSGLVVHVAAEVRADFIVKGLRTASDFEVEMQMAQTNHAVTGMHTVFLPTASNLGYLSSRFIREIAREGGDVTHLVPEPVARRLKDAHQR